jgi:hypothetical protein
MGWRWATLQKRDGGAIPNRAVLVHVMMEDIASAA